MAKHFSNKTLSRLDPHSNCAWLSKRTEFNMKCASQVVRLGEMRKGRRERIEKGSREGIEKRERDKKFEEEGLTDPSLFFNSLDPALQCRHCFFKSSGYDKLELKHQNVVFTSL